MSATGCYCDSVSERGVVWWQSGRWRHNLIVSSAWPLVAALLRKEPNAIGISFCAVGEGDSAWDRTVPRPTAETARLYREIARSAVALTEMRYIDAAGHPARGWTHRLELTITISPSSNPRTVREFGLFGGDATSTPNTGRLINYAVHPVIELRANQKLTRTIRLNFRPGGSAITEQGGGVPAHWLGNQPASLIDGVGDAVAAALKDAGATTIGELAMLQIVELRAKAQLAMQTAAQLVRAPTFSDKTIDDVLSTTSDESVPIDTLDRLQGQLGLLQVALDARWLKRRTMAELLASRAP